MADYVLSKVEIEDGYVTMTMSHPDKEITMTLRVAWGTDPDEIVRCTSQYHNLITDNLMQTIEKIKKEYPL